MKQTLALFLISIAITGLATAPAQAGCGCDKAPPEAASIRPNATYPGAEVSLFNARLVPGATYRVRFVSGTSGASASVDTVAVARFDLADARRKPSDRAPEPQLVVRLPNLPLGPTAVTVSAGGQSIPLFTIGDDALTVVAPPLPLLADIGEYRVDNVHGAVGRDGTVYFALDLTGITLPRVFTAQAIGYPLRFESKDLAFYNTQGFLMQLLNKKMPGLHAIRASDQAANSDVLLYSRHEFATYFMQHEERQNHQVSSDHNWHADGTPHIDHNHLILAIAGELNDGSSPRPGSTPALDLAFGTHSNFEQGIVATNRVQVREFSTIGSFDPRTGSIANEGDVYSLKEIKIEQRGHVSGSVAAREKVEVKDDGVVDGDAEAVQIDQSGRGRIGGAKRYAAARPVGLIEVQIPDGLTSLGKIEVNDGSTHTIAGPGSFAVDSIKVEDGELIIDNSAGPVTLYSLGTVEILDLGTVSVTDFAPEKFAIYVKPGKNVKLRGDSMFHGLIYAPDSDITLEGTGEFFGSIVGENIQLNDDTRIYYDPQLRGTGDGAN
jgi:hypothetical protein